MTDLHSTGEGEHVFSSRVQADRFLQDHFAQVTPDQIAMPAEVVSHSANLIQQVDESPRPPPGGFPVLVPRYRWVIKNEDLGLADALLGGLRDASSVGFFVGVTATAPAPWAAAVGVFTALFKLCRNVLNKGRVLTPDAYSVLVTLKALGPASSNDLLPKLRQIKPDWNAEALGKTLETLKAMPMRNGTARALVAQDEQGRWLTADV